MYESAQKEVMSTIRRDILPKFTAYLAKQTQTMCDDRRRSTAFKVCIDVELQVTRWTARFGFEYAQSKYVKAEMEEILNLGLREEQVLARLNELEQQLVESKYFLCKHIGEGGFGTVFRGKKRDTSEIVAIKVIDLEEDDVFRVSQEIANMQGKAVPQLVSLYDSIVTGYKLWIVMEYMDGGSVSDMMRTKKGMFREKHIAVIVREVLKGLFFLEKEKKIHRDVKAANILINRKGHIKLADFGAATELTESTIKEVIGSPQWMAPEVIKGEHYDGKADIWSLGVTCIEMALGVPPHSEKLPDAALHAILTDKPPELNGSEWTSYFRDFIRLCLVKDPPSRATLRHLLLHPFVKKAKGLKIMRELFYKKNKKT